MDDRFEQGVHKLRRLGVKFNLRTLRAIDENLINGSENPFYHAAMYHPGTKVLIKTHISAQWVQSFGEWCQIVSRELTGRLRCSPDKGLFIEREMGYHLGQLYGQIQADR